ncbi:MAG TPA: zf-TFIIB domain-containing protein [Polyangia bacterium]|nr:zf-TFIIB domain-containing protein [Polyangia bacterium]
MKCLRCGDVELEVQTRGEGLDVVEIDICPGCKGLWLDPSELAGLDDNFFVDIERIELVDVEPNEQDAALRCPRCEGAPVLSKVHPAGFSRVVLDTCPACHGFWLDRGEIEKMKDVSDRRLVADLFDLDD